MEQGPREKEIIEMCVRERRPFPESIANAPTLQLGLELFYMAFMDLTSCRSFGQGPGPIPWSSIHIWAQAHELDGEQREDLFYHVEHLDKAYLDWSMKKFKQDSEASKSKNKPKPKARPRG